MRSEECISSRIEATFISMEAAFVMHVFHHNPADGFLVSASDVEGPDVSTALNQRDDRALVLGATRAGLLGTALTILGHGTGF
jgi:hypothetical protein